MSTHPVYTVAPVVAPLVASRLATHRAELKTAPGGLIEAPLAEAEVVSALVEAAFWASLRREEGYVPTISLAFLPPSPDVHPLTFAQPLSLDPRGLARLGPAVERPGIHLGVWWIDGRLAVWGTTHAIPPLCLVIEVVAPGLIVLKHRPRYDSGKFVNLAIVEGDTVKVIDDGAQWMPECPALLSGLLGGHPDRSEHDSAAPLVQLAVSMRSHRRGGTLLVVPAATDDWKASVVHPLTYAVTPPFRDLAIGMATPSATLDEPAKRAIETIAGLTAVDGATVVTDAFALVAFGAKIRRKQGSPQVEQLVITEPVAGNTPMRVPPSQIGGTRHLSAAQFISDQREGLALVASQDGRFTLFAWSPREQLAHAHRVDALLM